VEREVEEELGLLAKENINGSLSLFKLHHYFDYVSGTSTGG
jgi:8-oxo-dGTP pyrophosphatase MutT (NUDIX family)